MACVRTLFPALLHTPLFYLAHTLIGTWAPPLVYQLLAAGNWVPHLRCGRSARRQISTLSQLLVWGWTPTAEAELVGYLLYPNETLIHPVPVWVLSVLVTLNQEGVDILTLSFPEKQDSSSAGGNKCFSLDSQQEADLASKRGDFGMRRRAKKRL